MNFFSTVTQYVLKSFSSNRRATVRYMFPVVFGFAIVLGAQLIGSTDSSYIRLETNKQAVETGELIRVGVYAYAHEPVNAVNVTVRFDDSKFDVVGVDRGQSVLTIWTEDPIIESGSVTLRGGTFRRGFLREHLIATIELRANTTGNGQFSAADVLLLAGDGQGTPVTTTETGDSTVSLYVYDENTNPGDIEIDVAVSIITDLDGDGKITLRDISSFMGAWSSNSTVHDFNGDGRMTFRDFSIILASYFFQ